MSNFNQGNSSVPTLINSSNCIVLGNTTSGTALTVQQLGAGAVMNVATSTGSSALFVSSTGQVGVGTATVLAGLQYWGGASSTSTNGAPGSGGVIIGSDATNGSPGDYSPVLHFRQSWYTQGQGSVTTGGITGYKTVASGSFGGGLAFLYCANGATSLSQGMTLNDTGRVGIGTTSPYSKLDVYGTISTSNVTTSSHGFISQGNGEFLSIEAFNSGNTGKLPVTLCAYGGNVGIGLTNPVATLDVYSTTATQWVSRIVNVKNDGGSSNTCFIHSDQAAVGTTNYTGSVLDVTSYPNDAATNLGYIARFGTSAADGTSMDPRVVILAGNGKRGYVGIGTTSPSYQLTVTSNIYNTSAGGGFYGMNCGNMDGLIQGVYNGGSANPDGLANSDIFIGVNYNQQTGQRLAGTNHGVAQIQLVGGNATVGAIKFRCLAAGTGAVSTIPVIQTITPTGVGIGTVSPQSALHVYKNGNYPEVFVDYGTGGQIISLSTGSSGAALSYSGYLAIGTITGAQQAGFSEKVRITSGGNVGIGTASPSCPLDVRGTGSVALSAGYYFSSGTSTLNSFGAANYNLSIFASNQIGASAFNASSDRRIKENIHTLTNALETVNKLRPVTYNYIDKLEHGEKTSHGFIAQEVEEVVPDAVGQTTAVVPTIYREADAFTETTITVTGHGLKTEKKLEVVDPENGKTTIDIVRVIDADNLEVKFEKVPKDKLFVVGPEVDDSRVLNHDHLMAVGFGGLKELHALVKTQQTTIEMLTERLAALESKLAA